MMASVKYFTILMLLHVACDGVVGSFKAPDTCGVCGGDNSTCRIVSGIFTRPQLPPGYNLITQIPAGACNLTIAELKHSKNYLALRKADGEFIINGNWDFSWTGDFNDLGTNFRYTRSEGKLTESIHSPGPLSEPVDLMILYEEPNPGIKYEYSLPIQKDLLNSGSTYFETERLSSAVDNTVDNNIDEQSQNQTQSELNGYQRTQSNTPADNDVLQRSRLRKRKVNWKMTGFSDCSKPCGGGIQVSIVVCVREYNQVPIPERRCGAVTKPNTQTIRCNNKPCLPQWVPEEWSRCSVTCGEGYQTRNVLCKQEITSSSMVTLSDSACLSQPPAHIDRRRTCYAGSCSMSYSYGQWVVGAWSTCSTSCGPGYQSRAVSCPSGDCPSRTRPASQASCENGPCSGRGDIPSGGSSYWFTTDWTNECTVECGTGVQTRKVFCPENEYNCDIRSKPAVSRACSSDRQCGGQWYTGPWSQCSEMCGIGKQTRGVVCLARIRGELQVTDDSSCHGQDRPSAEQQCRANRCESQWYMTDWLQCSHSCGTGIERREVRCLYDNQVESNQCRAELKPISHRSCHLQSCSPQTYETQTGRTYNSPHYSYKNYTSNGHTKYHSQSHHITAIGGCSDKYYNCQMVVQARLCKYKYYRTSCCSSCGHTTD